MERWDVDDAAYERSAHCKRSAYHLHSQVSAQAQWKAFQESTWDCLRAASLQQLIKEAERHKQSTPRPQSCSSWSNSVSNDDSQLWVQHEEAWKQVMQGAVILDASNIPWPPATQDLLECMASVEEAALENAARKQSTPTVTSSALRGARTTLLMRRAYAKACLRWHPDKFKTRVCKLVGESLQQQLVAHATLIFQAANNQWAAWVKQHKGSTAVD